MKNHRNILSAITLGLGLVTAPVAYAQSTGSAPTGMNNPSAPDKI